METERLPLLKVETDRSKYDPCIYPETYANLFTRATFGWLSPLLQHGASKPLQVDDLWDIQESDEALNMRDRLFKSLSHDEVDYHKNITPRSLWRAIHEAFGWNMYVAGVCKLCGDLLGFVAPICINSLIQYVETTSSAWFYPQYYGYIISMIFFVSTIAQTLFLHQHHHLVIREAIRVRAALTMIVYEKGFSLSSQTKNTLSSGHILNLATTDTNRILDFFYFVHYTWAAPLQVIIGMILLVHFLGFAAACAGIAMMIILLPLSAMLSAYAATISKYLIESTDQRIKLLGQVLHHIRMIKLYAWEPAMLNQIEEIRDQELHYLKRMMLWTTWSQVSLQAGPILVSLSAFAVYAWTQKVPLSPDRAFTSITLFTIFRLPLMMLPRIFSLCFQAHVSIQRLAEYFHQPELKSPSILLPRTVLGIQHGTFAWNDGPNSTLNDISITIPRGQLTMIVGPVGSGKSTLLAALLHELEPIKGKVFTPTQGISYAAQIPYLVNDTVEGNIVFGRPEDTTGTRLAKVIQACALENDVAHWSDGIKTELGENGINMSGGQKQRLSMARAIYPRDQQLYVFDDVFSALDQHVATSIFAKCLAEKSSLLAGQTRILATHSLEFARQAQWIIVMDKMQVVQMGTYEEVMRKIIPNSEISMHSSLPATEHIPENKDTTSQSKTPLMVEETRVVGSVSLQVYLSYLYSCGIVSCIGVGGVFLSRQMAQLSSDLWLTKWTSGLNNSTTYYVSIYAYLSFVTILLGFLGDLASRFVGIRGSQVIHHQLLHRVMRGTLRFFTTTPSGRILNRFSNDINTIDQKLSISMSACVTMFLSILSMLLIQCFTLSYLVGMLLPVSACYLLLQHYYRQSCRELQRMDNMTKSPIYSHFTQTLQGLMTLRAFDRIESSRQQQAKVLNENTRVFLTLNLMNRWLGIRLEFLGACLVLAVACLISLHTISSAMAGLLLSYAQGLTGLLNWMVRNSIDMENMSTSMERIDEYTTGIPIEMLEFETQKTHWSIRGAIRFFHVSVQYSPNDVKVLDNITFDIHEGEKVGICGRTGAGKSSLVHALFRLVACQEGGRIEIDGINIAHVNLSTLRQSMGLIPQDPVLFATTIRRNLDPYDELDDAMLWNVLSKTHLHALVSSFSCGLDEVVVEGGENFSVGQRQLFCLARVLLKKTKILCMDEATASMDPQTDALIQETIRVEFIHSTVLTIAHRIQTIADYDKILVLQQGRVLAFGTPQELRSQGVFSYM